MYKLKKFFMPVLFISVLAAGCKHKSPEKNMQITVTVKGDSNVIILPEAKTFTADKGESWAKLKYRAEKTANAKDGFGILSWRLDGASGDVLKPEHKFEEDTVIYAVAAVKLKMSEVAVIVYEDYAVLEWANVPGAGIYELVWNGGEVKNVTSPHEEKNLTKDFQYTFTIKARGEGFVDSGFTEKTITVNPFVIVTPPSEGFIPLKDDSILPSEDAAWKGVLIENRPVKLDEFKMGKYEVTYKLWNQVYERAKTMGYNFAAGQKGSNGEGSENEPVTKVSWRDCVAWCNAYTEITMGGEFCVYRKGGKNGIVLKKASECSNVYACMEKKGFRLPTEAEWEYAARCTENGTFLPLDRASGAEKSIGFETSVPVYGETWESLRDELTRVAVYGKWFNGISNKWESQTPAVTKTAPAGSKAPNGLGIYDMSGNASEWCFDWLHENVTLDDNLYKVGAFVVNPQGPQYGSYRVTRGGSWEEEAKSCCAGMRGSISPDYGSEISGFRLVCRP